MIRYLILVFLGFGVLRSSDLRAGEESPAVKPNVLFIAVDDLKPELGCYGKPQIKSPNIDRLASHGTVFEKAYCMVSICGASRASLMTGVRPKHDRFVTHLAEACKEAPEAITLNTHFKNHGYTTVSNGKVFHVRTDNADGWSLPPWALSAPGPYASEETNRWMDEQKKASENNTAWGPAWECADVPDNTYNDGKVLDRSLLDLRRLVKEKKPFFLGVGFQKPHLPFTAPKKYWDMYDSKTITFPGNYKFTPKDAPKEAIHTFGELRRYKDIPKEGPLSDEAARTLIHGYYAAVSYVDALIGQLLDELEKLGVAENTIVVLWGDHGWLLGEHTMWCKQCVFETAMAAPLIISIPGQKKPLRVASPVEFVDVYPTLCELASLPEPKKDQLQGKSLVSLLQNPDFNDKHYAVGRFGAGDTIFDGRYRYSEFRAKKGAGDLVSKMLYDHQNDPNEDVNVIDRPENAAVIETLSKELNRVMQLP